MNSPNPYNPYARPVQRDPNTDPAYQRTCARFAVLFLAACIVYVIATSTPNFFRTPELPSAPTKAEIQQRLDSNVMQATRPR